METCGPFAPRAATPAFGLLLMPPLLDPDVFLLR